VRERERSEARELNTASMASQRDFTHRTTWINVLLRLLQLILPYIQHGESQFQGEGDRIVLFSLFTNATRVWKCRRNCRGL